MRLHADFDFPFNCDVFDRSLIHNISLVIARCDSVLAHGVYWIFAEPRLVTYIQAGRRALWPDPTSSPPRPRGVDEMEKARREAERRILRTIPGKKQHRKRAYMDFLKEDGI